MGRTTHRAARTVRWLGMLPEVRTRLVLVRLTLCVLGLAVIVWCVERGLARGGAPNADFFDFYWAAHALRTGGDLWASGDGGYIYPPFLAMVLVPITLLEPAVAATLWTLLMIVCLLLSMDVGVRIAACVLQIPLHWSQRLAAQSLALIPLAECMRREFEWSNCNPLIMLAWAAGIWWITHRPRLAGIALGIAAMIKYLPLGMLALLLLRRRWHESAWMAGTIVLLAFAPALLRGWEQNLTDLSIALGGLARMAGFASSGPAAGIIPIDADYSHSITSGLARLVRDGALPSWTIGAGVMLAIATTASVWFLISWRKRSTFAPWWSASGERADTDMARRILLSECLLAIALSLAVSPQTQQRHLNLLLPVMAVLAVLLLRGTRATRWWMCVAMVVFAMGATAMPSMSVLREFIESSWKYAGGPGWAIIAGTLLVCWRLVADPPRLASPSVTTP